jgi:hypothetical protein
MPKSVTHVVGICVTHVPESTSLTCASFRRTRTTGHALTIDAGWREVAEKALEFIKRLA